jgi:hypothetical protein
LPVMGIIALSLSACVLTSGFSANAGGPNCAERAVEQAKEDLARRRGVDKGEIGLVAVEVADWPDTSLGCPQPDMMYAQVITPGFRIVLSHADEAYVYHSDRRDRVVYCQPGSP